MSSIPRVTEGWLHTASWRGTVALWACPLIQEHLVRHLPERLPWHFFFYPKPLAGHVFRARIQPSSLNLSSVSPLFSEASPEGPHGVYLPSLSSGPFKTQVLAIERKCHTTIGDRAQGELVGLDPALPGRP